MNGRLVRELLSLALFIVSVIVSVVAFSVSFAETAVGLACGLGLALGCLGMSRRIGTTETGDRESQVGSTETNETINRNQWQ